MKRPSIHPSLLLSISLIAGLATLPGGARASEPDKPDPLGGQGGLTSADRSNGDFNYSIPLSLPAWSGPQPSLSLSYSSSAGNGYLGVGWSISGLGQIVRGAPGRWGAPSFTSNDTFSLDGQLLLPCPDDGSSSTTVPSCQVDANDPDPSHVYYATQIESFRAIYLDRGPAVNGGWGEWVVLDPSGTRSHYSAAYIVDAAITPDNVYKWLLTRVEDPSGNYYSVDWGFNHFGCCAEYPQSIRYHYPAGDRVVATFFWEQREDVDSILLSKGNHRMQHARLKGVSTQSPEGERLRAYDLSYATSPTTRRSLLTGVSVYGDDHGVSAPTPTTTGAVIPGPSGALVAGRPTYEFDYINDAAANAFHDGGAGPAAGWCGDGKRTHYGDWNGDGRTDILCWDKAASAVSVALSNGDGFDAQPAPWSTGWCPGSVEALQIADFNGDGKDDIACADYSVKTALSTGSGFTPGPETWSACPLTGQPRWYGFLTTGDFDGDGMADLACHHQGSMYVTRAMDVDGDGQLDSFEGGDPNQGQKKWADVGCSDGGSFGTGDFNGDGAMDVYCADVAHADGQCGGWSVYRHHAYVNVFLSDADHAFSFAGDWGSGNAPGSESDRGFCTAKLGSAPLECETVTGLKNLITGDFNGDGKTDILCHDGDWRKLDRGQVQVALSKGSSPDTPQVWSAPMYCEAGESGGHPYWARITTTDANGDGRTDVACIREGIDFGNNNTHVSLSNGASFYEPTASPWRSKWCTDNKLMFLDVNGDTKGDLVCTNFRSCNGWSAGDCGADQGYRVALSGGTHGLAGTRGPTDLVERVTDAIGGAAAVGYTPGSAFSMDRGPAQRRPLVTEIRRADGIQLTDAMTAPPTRYAYAGGVHDRVERRFLGFREMTAEEPWAPGDADASGLHGPVTVTVFAQDYRSLLKPLWIGRYAKPGGDLLTVDSYAYVTSGAAPYTALLAEERRATCAPGQTAPAGQTCGTRREAVTASCAAYGGGACAVASYDIYGNRLTATTYTVDSGNPAAHLVEQTTATQYAAPAPAALPGAFIVNRVQVTSTYQGTSQIDAALLSRTKHYYDDLPLGQIGARGALTSTARCLSATDCLVTSKAEYDAYGRITRSERAVGGADFAPTWTYYDDYSRVIETKDALLRSTFTSYDLHGRVESSTDVNSQATVHEYDAFGRLVHTTRPGGGWEHRAYLSIGYPGVLPTGTQRIEISRPGVGTLQDEWTTTYLDGMGRAWRTGRVANQPASDSDFTTRTVLSKEFYDARGQVTTRKVPYFYGQNGPYQTTMTHDALGRTVVTTLPDGTSQSASYDLAEPGVWGTGIGTTKTIDPSGTPSLSATGALSDRTWQKSCEYVAPAPGYSGGAWHCRKQEEHPFARQSKTFEPNASGSPTVLVGTADRDMLGRVVHTWDAARGDVTTRHDLADRPVRSLDARGALTCTTYDLLGRVTLRATKAGAASVDAGCAGAEEESLYHYDDYSGYPGFSPARPAFNVGRRTVAVKKLGGVESSRRYFAYDAEGRVSETLLVHADGKMFRRAMTYDANGRLTSLVYPDGDEVQLAYDNAGMPNAMSAGGAPLVLPGSYGSDVSQWQYDASGHVQHIGWSGGITRKMIYSPTRGWLTEIDARDPAGAPLLSYGYARDAVGAVSSVSSTLMVNEGSKVIYTFTDAATFAYDSQHRMKYAASVGTSGKWHFTMSYSPTGDVLSRNGHKEAGGGITDIGPRGNYGYAGPAHAVTEITSFTGPAAPIASFAYDAAGNMTQYKDGSPIEWSLEGKPASMTANGASMTFVYDADGERIRSTAGAVTTYHDGDFEWDGATASRYLRFGGQLVARRARAGWTPPIFGQPPSDELAGGFTTEILHTNHLGSVVMTTTTAGQRLSATIYSPWGDRIAGTRTGAFTYTGEREDETGLMYLSARYYDPSISRFLSADTIVPGGALSHLNRYAYVSNSPMRLTDPSGHREADEDSRSKPRTDPPPLPPPQPIVPLTPVVLPGSGYQPPGISASQPLTIDEAPMPRVTASTPTLSDVVKPGRFDPILSVWSHGTKAREKMVADIFGPESAAVELDRTFVTPLSLAPVLPTAAAWDLCIGGPLQVIYDDPRATGALPPGPAQVGTVLSIAANVMHWAETQTVFQPNGSWVENLHEPGGGHWVPAP